MNTYAIRTLAAILSVILLRSVVLHAAPPGNGWNLVFSDEFDGSTLDTSKWNSSATFDWDENGAQCWTYPENIKVSNSTLRIENKWLSSPGVYGELYSGGGFVSKEKFNQGYFEARVRIEWADEHFWPTFWLWEWRPDGSANEFDIMEAAGHVGHYVYPSYSHHYPYKTSRSNSTSLTRLDEWHVWGLLWTDTEVSFYQDGIKKFSSSRPDLAKDDILPILFTCSPNRFNNPARSGTYPSFLIDWVRVWQGGTAPSTSGPPIGQTIAIVAKGPNKFVAADKMLDTINWPLAGNRTAVGSWEKFEVVDAGGGAVAFKAVGNNKFVAADGFNNWRLMANRSTIGGSWEKFEWIDNPDATFSLRALGNNKVIVSDRNLDPANWPLEANRNSVGGDWEKFNWEPR